jgi:DNA-binding protein YbaB
VAEAMAKLEAHQRKMLAAREELTGATASVRSPDRTLTAVVDMRGELRELKLHTEDYRSMAPAQLESLIVKTVQAARAQAAERVAEKFAPFLGSAAAIRESISGDKETDDLYAPLRALRPIDPVGMTGESA